MNDRAEKLGEVAVVLAFLLMGLAMTLVVTGIRPSNIENVTVPSQGDILIYDNTDAFRWVDNSTFGGGDGGLTSVKPSDLENSTAGGSGRVPVYDNADKFRWVDNSTFVGVPITMIPSKDTVDIEVEEESWYWKLSVFGQVSLTGEISQYFTKIRLIVGLKAWFQGSIWVRLKVDVYGSTDGSFSGGTTSYYLCEMTTTNDDWTWKVSDWVDFPAEGHDCQFFIEAKVTGEQEPTGWIGVGSIVYLK